MTNKFDEMRQAVDEARTIFRAADECAGSIAQILKGRLRSGNIYGGTLTALKKELRDWNIHTGEWKPK